MISKLQEIFNIPELKRKILFTLALLVVYRIGSHITVPGVDPSEGPYGAWIWRNSRPSVRPEGHCADVRTAPTDASKCPTTRVPNDWMFGRRTARDVRAGSTSSRKRGGLQ